ncbi:MAG: NAD(P)H-dependent oxidoreductase subunit E [Lachnospiraceae bacterium]
MHGTKVVEALEISKESIEKIIHTYEQDQRYALAIMQDMQRTFQYVPKEGMQQLSAYLGCPISSLYAMATFYKALSLEPKGRHIIKCCDGTACHIRGSSTLIDGIQNVLGIHPSETTKDGEFSFETVNCLGSCALAPVLVVDDVYYGKVTLEKLRKILEETQKGGAAE